VPVTLPAGVPGRGPIAKRVATIAVLAVALLAAFAVVPAAGAQIHRTTSLVSASTGVPDPVNRQVEYSGASADGSRVFFETAQKLTSGDRDSGRVDLYMAAPVTGVCGGSM
jgi:hypothetical protein